MTINGCVFGISKREKICKIYIFDALTRNLCTYRVYILYKAFQEKVFHKKVVGCRGRHLMVTLTLSLSFKITSSSIFFKQNALYFVADLNSAKNKRSTFLFLQFVRFELKFQQLEAHLWPNYEFNQKSDTSKKCFSFHRISTCRIKFKNIIWDMGKWSVSS